MQNIYEEGELSKDSTVSKMEIIQNEGSRIVKRTNVMQQRRPNENGSRCFSFPWS